METEKVQKVPTKFSCDLCDYFTSRRSQYERHLNTSKHLKMSNFNKMEPKSSSEYICSNCDKVYKDRSGLWKHNKMCIEKNNPENIVIAENENNENKEIKMLTNLVLKVVKNNSELQKQTYEMQKQMLELYKQGAIGVHNSHNTNNSHNKTFNLQFFLNETCKDAMNIMDFVDSFTLQLSDLEDVSKQGYVDGISGIIMKKLNEMDVHKRPIHCSDAKREIMYVKDQNRWEKEDMDYTKLRKAIKYISKKNSDLLGQWSEAHPASKNITTQTNTEYMQMIVQAMGGRGEIGENEKKIIKKIAKTVLIEKD